MTTRQHGSLSRPAAAARWPRWLPGRLAALTLTLALAACAGPGSPAPTTIVAATQPAAAASPTTAAQPTLAPPAPPATAILVISAPTAAPATVIVTTVPSTIDGCPQQQAPGSASAPPDVVLSGQGAGVGGSASLGVGQVLEVRLGPQLQWTLTPPDPARVLAPLDGNGWYDAISPACVWRFTGQAPGMVSLSFSGRPICPPGQACPAFVVLSKFTVTVKG